MSVHYSAYQWLRSDAPSLCLSGRDPHPDEKLLSDLMVEDKRRRKDVFSLEEELLTYKFLVRERNGRYQCPHTRPLQTCIQ